MKVLGSHGNMITYYTLDIDGHTQVTWIFVGILEEIFLPDATYKWVPRLDMESPTSHV